MIVDSQYFCFNYIVKNVQVRSVLVHIHPEQEE